MKCASPGEGGSGCSPIWQSYLLIGKLVYVLQQVWADYQNCPFGLKNLCLYDNCDAAAWFRDQHCNTEPFVSLVSSTLWNHFTCVGELNKPTETWTERAGEKRKIYLVSYSIENGNSASTPLFLWLSLIHVEIDLTLNTCNALMKAQPT